jgi:hypothetical protein
VIAHLIREIKELAISRKETKDLREGINGIKEEIHYLRNKLPESKFQFYYQSPTNNRKDNSQDDTGKSKEGIQMGKFSYINLYNMKIILEEVYRVSKKYHHMKYSIR